MKHAASLVLLALVLGTGSRAAADAKQDRARAHFGTGIELLDAHEYARALGEFRAAYALWPNPKILLNIGTTLKQLGRDAEAANAYARYLASAEADPAKTSEVRSSLEAIDSEVGRLGIAASEEDAEVLVDGASSSEWARSEPLRVAVGTHTVVARKAGFAPAVVTVSVERGELRPVELVLVSQGEESSAPASSAAAPAQPAHPPAEPVDRGPRQGDEAGPLGVFMRVDVDGEGRGAVVAPGIAFHVGEHFALGAAGLIGREKGGWAGARVLPWKGTIAPSLLLGVPVFVVSGPRVGVQGALGVVYNAAAWLSLSIDLGIAHFPSPPPGYQATVFVPSLAVETRL